ncbi:flagellar filament capping protein FliD [Parachitinimonas caeni]|uniref:Flagellar hook-associated protein 2 n=1 Tax=Parachitinimonas caeni TaxID=3031301 RepID=A0ABT7DUW2_9NEIS|nr:flagellar filament capping protein FliD [Parachitinimonas caeni]MDK2123609.1 flagellar filament capping protein FliD [Parachitinimonas caeni]
MNIDSLRRAISLDDVSSPVTAVSASARTASSRPLGIAPDYLQASVSSRVQISDQGRLRAALADFQTAVGEFSSADRIAPIIAESDNTRVSATVESSEGLPKSLEVNVSQLAQSQQLQSTDFADRDASLVGTGTLTLEFGRYNPSGNTFNQGFSPTRTVKIEVNDGTVAGIAKTVNLANTGISAQVQVENGRFRLSFTTASGAEQSVQIAVDDSDGSNRDDATGLSRLSFIPSEQPATGRNQTEVTTAQDALLTVNGAPVISSENTVRNAIPNVSLDLKEAGLATITFRRDVDAAVRNLQSLATAYNDFRGSAASSATRQSTDVTGKLAATLRSTQLENTDTTLTLADVGLELSDEGELVVNEASVRAVFQSRPEDAVTLIASAAQQLSDTARNELGALPEIKDTRVAAGDGGENPFVANARLQQLQSVLNGQPTLLAASLSTRNLYGLAQYLAIAQL